VNSIQAEISPSNANLGVPTIDDPFLCLRSVAVVATQNYNKHKHISQTGKMTDRKNNWQRTSGQVSRSQTPHHGHQDTFRVPVRLESAAFRGRLGEGAVGAEAALG